MKAVVITVHNQSELGFWVTLFNGTQAYQVFKT
jgi:hypothetical protein